MRDLQGSILFSFSCISDERAEDWVCYILNLRKRPTRPKEMTLSSLFFNKSHFIQKYPDSLVSLTSIVNTSLLVKIESLQTVAAIPPEDRMDYVNHCDLSETGIRSVFWRLCLGCIDGNCMDGG
ncbi:hypothetical protein WA171_006612 [Blastocystis sp. BT1]